MNIKKLSLTVKYFILAKLVEPHAILELASRMTSAESEIKRLNVLFKELDCKNAIQPKMDEETFKDLFNLRVEPVDKGIITGFGSDLKHGSIHGLNIPVDTNCETRQVLKGVQWTDDTMNAHLKSLGEYDSRDMMSRINVMGKKDNWLDKLESMGQIKAREFIDEVNQEMATAEAAYNKIFGGNHEG